jgi:hypothetical protein
LTLGLGLIILPEIGNKEKFKLKIIEAMEKYKKYKNSQKK